MNRNILNINGNYSLIFIVIMTVIAIILLVLFILEKRKNSSTEINFLQSFIHHFKPALGIEKNLDYILSKTQEWVEAPTYCFYLFNPTNQRYTLKAVRQLAVDTNIAPSYSGLLPYEKEKFDPPLSLPKESLPPSASILNDGEVPLLIVPVKGGKGMIRIGPISKAGLGIMKTLNQLSRYLEKPLDNLLEEEGQRRNYEVLETSEKAVKYINRLFIYEVEYIKLTVQTCIKSTNPNICLVLESNSSFCKESYSMGLKRNLQIDLNFFQKIKEVIEDKNFSIFQPGTVQHSKLNQLLSLKETGYFVSCQFTLLSKQYVLLFTFDYQSKNMENTRSQAIKMLWTQVNQFLKIKHHVNRDFIAYVDFLKCLADLIDQMSPYTIGSSRLMANYSMAIAKELGLGQIQIQTIGLAAYLSNIGIIGLSDGLLDKEGVYSDKEYEQMKLHSEVGAAIIENMIAHEEVAALVRHHHERMDGNGYPSRLMGENIPLGSKIIAVVQTFLAKINGRNYREPLPFDAALKLINDSAGVQLDRKVVYAFLKWYESKRSIMQRKSKALGNCWDLCCVPAAICSQCPVYGNTKTNCWEVVGNNCHEHGKNCKSCFVYTEAKSRIQQNHEVVL